MADTQHTCAGCGVQFERTGRGNRQYCQVSCRPPKKQAPYIGRMQRPAPCEGCGAIFGLTKGLCPPCSKAQRAISALHFRRDYYGRSHLPPVLREATDQTAECEECKVSFAYVRTPQFTKHDRSRRYCSRLCQKRSSDRNRTKRRRALTRSQHTELVDVNAVFDRDGWRCCLCGVKTPKAKRGTYHPRAPELDHIVALANGGSHTYQNTQCACRSCNAAKGASDYGQIPLFATA